MTETRPRLLLIDDDSTVRDCLSEALRPLCSELKVAGDLRQAFDTLDKASFDIIVSDICMPNCSGMDLLRVAHQLNWDCAIILMTGYASLEQVSSSFRLNAADFLVKPFTLEMLSESVQKAYRRIQAQRRELAEREQLSLGLRVRTEELNLTRQSLQDSYRSAMETLVATMDEREPQICAHSFRVRTYALHLATLLNCPADVLPLLASAALLHDVGLVAVSDSVLQKPGTLSDVEFDQVKNHCIAGERIVRRVQFLGPAATIIRHHHERWDGQGYPDGLRGTDIPFESRLFAIADTLDAMTEPRCYRKSSTFAEVRVEIERFAGSQFDPEMARVFADVTEATWMGLRQHADKLYQAATKQRRALDPVIATELQDLIQAAAGR